MKDSIKNKLEQLVSRFDEVTHLLGDSEVLADQDKYVALSKEYAELNPVVDKFKELVSIEKELKENIGLQKDDDLEVREIAKEEINYLNNQLLELEEQLSILLLPSDPNDQSNVFIEIRAGAGGDEASIFAGDLMKMYSRYAENNGWKIEIISSSQSEQGGYKEVVLKIIGTAVYSVLKFESGVHRVQRVPLTESQGRIHTSTCTVAIMPEIDADPDIEIKPQDLRIDTFRASGAGGQHVNRTDSAVRLTHLETGIVVECQDDRSQHKNKAKAMSLLLTKLHAQRDKARHDEESSIRKNLVGTGDRSERIRTYNFPQGRLTDHRINLTLYKLTEIIEGDLTMVIDALRKEYQADQLAELSKTDF